MEFSITIDDKEISFLGESQPLNTADNKSNSISYIAKTPYGNIVAQEIKGNGFIIWNTEYFFTEEVVLQVKSSKPLLFLHFLFGSSIRIAFDKTEIPIIEGQFNFSYFPMFQAIIKTGRSKRLQTFHIHFEPHFFEAFKNGSKKLIAFLTKVEQNVNCQISDNRHFATPEMIRVINSLIHNPYKSKNLNLFTASQVNVLLLQTLHKVNKEDQKQNQIRLTLSDKEKLTVAKNYLVKHLDELVYIKQLAQIAGMNDNKLKRGFKQLFGNTISTYHEDLRLQKAMRLMIETDMPVEEIAYSVGYRNAAHFSDKFKRKFQFPPTYFRNP